LSNVPNQDFIAFELTCEGVNALINYVENLFDVSIIYQPGASQIMIAHKSEAEKLNAEKMDMGIFDQETLFPEIRTLEGSLYLSTALGADFILLGEMADQLTREAKVSKMTLPEFINDFFKMKIRNRLETSSDQS
jgi:hypothetical protein